MSKSYIFTLEKYYSDEEIAKVSPIIENYVNMFGDNNGVATLNLKDDVKVVIKKEEGLVLHMLLDNPDHFTALPKKLARPRDFLATFITAMAKAVDEKAKIKTDIASAKAKVEADAENSLFDYIGGAGVAVDKPEAKTTVKVNGEEITDPDEKKKVEEDVDAKLAEAREHFNKVFGEAFDGIFKTLFAKTIDTDSDWIKKYLG